MAGKILGTTVYYDADCNLSKLEGKKITVLGYGSQGHAHALNLKENGMDVTIGLRGGSSSWKAAEEAGLTVKETAEAVKGADIVPIHRYRFGNLPLAAGEVHIANVKAGNRHAALHQAQEVRRSSAHQQDLLPVGGAVNVVDGFLQRPEARGDPFRQHHLHQILLHRIFGNLIIGDQHQVGAGEADPLHANLAVDQAFINAAQYDIWHYYFPRVYSPAQAAWYWRITS